MELSAIVKEFDVPLTHTEDALVARLGTGTSAAAEDRYKQQMKALATARAVVNQLPDKQTTDRQRNMAKAAMLKERLKMLRQMIPFLSPSAAKSLIAEMKQIASQLASLGAESGGATISAGAANGASAANTPESGTEAETDTALDTTQPSETDTSDGGTPQQQASSDGALQKSGTTNAEDRQWKEAVEELKNLYKAVMAALKRKQQSEHDNKQPSHLRAYAAIPDDTHNVAVNA